MSGGAKKAAPREKDVKFSEARYLVTEVPHFINAQLVQPGTIVNLPEGVKPGAKLVEVDEDGNPVKAKADPKGKKDDGKGEF